jgi:hypothetical protein
MTAKAPIAHIGWAYMISMMAKTPRILVSVALIVAGPICTWFIAREQLVPVWIASAIGMVITICGIGVLGSLMRQTSQG